MLGYQGCGCKVSPEEVPQEGVASCVPTKQGFWKDAKLEQIGNNHTTVCESNYKTIKTEWNLTLDRDSSSFTVSDMTIYTDQLLQVKVATNVGNIYPHEHEANINCQRKTLVQSLKQFHADYYWLYKKGMTCTMVGLLGLHLDNTLKCPSISAGMGPKLFWPWCLKLGGNTEMIATHLHGVHYQMVIACDICWAFASMTTQNI